MNHPPSTIKVLIADDNDVVREGLKTLLAAGYITKQSVTDELITAVQCVLGGGKYVLASLAGQAWRQGAAVCRAQISF